MNTFNMAKVKKQKERHEVVVIINNEEVKQVFEKDKNGTWVLVKTVKLKKRKKQ